MLSFISVLIHYLCTNLFMSLVKIFLLNSVFFSKVEQQSYLYACCFKIIKQLKFFLFAEYFRRFVFDNHAIIYNNIRKIISSKEDIIENSDKVLALALNSHSSQLDQYGIMINLFEKSAPQDIIDLIISLNNLFCNIVMKVLHL